VKNAKFLFVAANEGAKWGGSEVLWSSAAAKLAKRGAEVRVSVPDWGGAVPQVERLRSAGCLIFYRRPPSFLRRVLRKFWPLPNSARSHVRSVGNGMDLVVISQGNNTDGLRWMEHSRAAGYRYAVIAQCASEAWWPDDDIAERLSASYESASRAYFVSQANLDLSRRQFVSPLGNSKVIRNPFNVPYDARPPWPTNEGEGLSLACVGRLEVTAKGQDLLLEVLSLPHWRQRKVRLSIVGEGVNGRMLRRAAQELKLTGVEFKGHVSDVEEVWRRHHVLVLPSRHEGMPLSVVEAMLCSRPCIVTNVAGNRDLVRDGVNGFLAKAPTVELLDEAMNRAWDRRNQLIEMGGTAAIDVRQWVSRDPAEDFAQELLTLVDSANAG
jgi:glycosyltransferase involved in cell wall biosynthesis